MDNENQAFRELANQIASDAEKMALSVPPAMASMSVLIVADQIVRHMHTHGAHLDAETLATLRLAAVTLHHCSRLFPPTLNIDGSALTPPERDA